VTADRLNAGALRGKIAGVWDGFGRGEALVEEFRRGVVLLPMVGESGVLTGDYGGVRWVYAFTAVAELAAFAAARGVGDEECRYLTVRGARLLDALGSLVAAPAGVAVDVAGRRPMMFPPVRGIVADEFAVDAPQEMTARQDGTGPASDAGEDR
jgi:hypothetical protein